MGINNKIALSKLKVDRAFYYFHTLSVLHIGEEESAGGSTSAGAAEVFGCDNLLELLDGVAATTHIYQSAHNGTYHIAQKPVGTDSETECSVALHNPLSMRHMTDVCLIIRIKLCKRCEVLILKEPVANRLS